MGVKLIKDPIYGYLRIESDEVVSLIDSAEFQRLRNIRQTSYSAVYPTSVHNRFVHSLGVYYLGNIVIGNLLESCENDSDVQNFLSSYKDTFLFACILHDIGHAPFSHTGEEFYLEAKDESTIPLIKKRLVEKIADDEFKFDAGNKPAIGGNVEFTYEFGSSAPHEVMSALVGITLLESKGMTFDKDLFARLITGTNYSNDSDLNRSLKNCMISILHSSNIDVDRLDYVMRDAYMSGFLSTAIDYERLYKGLKLISPKDDGHYELSYHKNSLSVLDSVIIALDFERKWVQDHPVMKYDNTLVEALIRAVNSYAFGNKVDLFSAAALSKDGVEGVEKPTLNELQELAADFKIENKNSACGDSADQLFSAIKDAWDNPMQKLRLVADEDVIFIAKNHCYKKYIDEYFDRSSRRKPLWKSEAEYKSRVEMPFLTRDELSEDNSKSVIAEAKILQEFLVNNFNFPYINDAILSELKGYEKRVLNALAIGNMPLLKWTKALYEAARTCDIEKDFAIITTDRKESRFNDEDFNDINIHFPGSDVSRKKGKLHSSYKGDEDKIDKGKSKTFFYVYYKKADLHLDIDLFIKTFFTEKAKYGCPDNDIEQELQALIDI